MDSNRTRFSPGIRIERLGMILRYGAYIVFVGLFWAGYIEGRLTDLAIITGVVLCHNVFVHVVLWTRRYGLFFSRLNFVIHLLEMSLVVLFTGAEESELFVLYLFLLIGYAVYSRSFGRILAATIVSCAAYMIVVGIEFKLKGLALSPGIVLIKVMSIPVCGWMVASMSRMMANVEEASRARAQALASSEAMLRAILDSAADPILVYDENEFITEANDKACEFLGTARRQIIGHDFRAYLFDDGSVPEKMAEAEAAGEYRGDQIVVDMDGRERTVELHIRSFMREHRRFFAVVAHDITHRKNLQEATQLTNANLARLNQELQQVNSLRIGLLDAISQRIRSPLTALLGFIDLLLNDELGSMSQDQRKALQGCRRSATRIFRLMDEMLSVPASAGKGGGRTQ